MLSRQYTKDALTDLKYAAIDIRIKDDNSESGIFGLLMGYKALTSNDNEKDPNMNKLFVWVYNKKSVYLYNLEHYEIRSIEIAVGDRGKTVQFTNFANKQDKAIKSILEIIEALKEQNKIQTNGLIDVYKYECLTSILKDDLVTSSKPAIPSTLIHGITYPYRSGNTINNNYTPISHKPEETKVKALFMERNNKYPLERALEKMRRKIEKIKDGTYKPPKLEKTLEDTVNKVDKEDKNDKKEDKDNNEEYTADNEDFYGAGGMYGCF